MIPRLPSSAEQTMPEIREKSSNSTSHQQPLGSNLPANAIRPPQLASMVQGGNSFNSDDSSIRHLCELHNRGRDYSGYKPEEANFLKATRLSSTSTSASNNPEDEGVEVTLDDFLNHIGCPENNKNTITNK